MKELQEQDSKLRWARCEELVEEQAEKVALFRQASRRCSNPSGKIKALDLGGKSHHVF